MSATAADQHTQHALISFTTHTTDDTHIHTHTHTHTHTHNTESVSIITHTCCRYRHTGRRNERTLTIRGTDDGHRSGEIGRWRRRRGQHPWREELRQFCRTLHRGGRVARLLFSTDTCAHTHTHTHTHTHPCKCTHAFMYANIHANTYTQTQHTHYFVFFNIFL